MFYFYTIAHFQFALVDYLMEMTTVDTPKKNKKQPILSPPLSNRNKEFRISVMKHFKKEISSI